MLERLAVASPLAMGNVDLSASVQDHTKATELSVAQRIISASVGAVLTSLLVTPLDVVKTRLQAQVQQVECGEARSPAQCPRCTHYSFHNGLMDVMLPKSLNPQTFKCPEHFTGTFDALYKIAKYEGFRSLYNGLQPSLIMAVPSTVLYFATYDKLRDIMRDEYNLGHTIAPLLAGSSARTLAATVIAPLELVRTRMQAVNNPPSIAGVVQKQIQSEGFISMWRGLWPTLLRDVPFSAIYWVCVERSREVFRPYVIHHFGRHGLLTAEKRVNVETGLEETSSLEEFGVSFVAGAFGGFVAATCTNPFDVVKTRRQVFDYTPDLGDKSQYSNKQIMRRIWVREGLQGFFVGLTPRLGKIMPACAIMLSSYEAGKKIFLSSV